MGPSFTKLHLGMDPGLHVKQGLHHLERVLKYAPFVEEDGQATVHLTPEDWHVVADTLFHMDTPKSLIPEPVTGYVLSESGDAIEITTTAYRISICMF